MRTLCCIVIALLMFGCNQSGEVFKTVASRPVVDHESFITSLTGDKSPLSIHKYDRKSESPDSADATFGINEWFEVSFKDTTIAISTMKKEKEGRHRFISAKFLNNEETCLLAEYSDSLKFKSFYLIALKDEGVEVVNLDRPTPESYKMNYNRMDRVASAAFLINNDVLLTKSDLKIYFIKRPNEDERIQGHFIMPSPDRKTLVYQLPSQFYQVHYPTGTVFVQPVDPSRIEDRSNYYSWIQSDFSWEKDKNGCSFLKKINEDRIIEMNL